MVGNQRQGTFPLSDRPIFFEETRVFTLIGGHGAGFPVSTRAKNRGTPAVRMIETEQHFDPGVRAANLALTGRKRQEVSRITSLELRYTDPRSEPWEALAMISVAALALLVVVGLWLA
jgi:hypothetical protein